MRIIYKLPPVIITVLCMTACFGSMSPAPERVVSGGTPTSQMQEVLSSLQELGGKPLNALDAVSARLQPTATDAVLSLLQKKGTAAPEKLPPVGMVEMKSFVTHDGATIPLRVYTPAGDGPFPVVVYFHGGGWVIATLDTYDASARSISALAKAVVVSVEYRKAPEFKFPTAHEDGYEAFRYVDSHLSQFKGNPGKLFVAGESAGGSIANAVSFLALERNTALPTAAALVYPVVDSNLSSKSYIVNANAKPLNAPMMKWFFDNYLGAATDQDSYLISPLRADPALLRRLPPTTIVTASIDPLQSEGVAYAKKLEELGVKTRYMNYEGVTHEFFGMAAVVDEAALAEKFVANTFK